MATKKSSNKTSRASSASATRLKRVHQAVLNNLTACVMITSIVLNLFFLTGIVLYHTSSSFEESVQRYVVSHGCDDKPASASQASYDLVCVKGQFVPYYEKAVNDYNDLLKRQSY